MFIIRGVINQTSHFKHENFPVKILSYDIFTTYYENIKIHNFVKN